MNPLVSIIIPVYNLEAYIQNCVTNLLAQTYQNLELIFVDDGSTDGSAGLLRRAAEQDARIRWIHKENGGVSSARNAGLAEATGDCIMFVDGDDALHPRAAELFVSALESEGADVVFSFFSESACVSPEFPPADTCSPQPFAWERMLEKQFSVLGVSVCAKLFRRETVRNLQFAADIAVGEDASFMFDVLRRDPKICYYDVPLYSYYQRPGSAMHVKIDSKREFIVKATERVCADFQPEDPPYLQAFYLGRLFQFLCYERTLLYGIPSQKAQLKKYRSIGEDYLPTLLRCRPLGGKRYLYWLFFRSRPLYELYRLVKDPTMKDFYKQRKQKRSE